MIYGDGGLGKSWLALQLAVAVAAGAPFLGKPTRTGPVLYLDFEEQEEHLAERVEALSSHYGVEASTLDAQLHIGVFSSDGRKLDQLQRWALERVSSIEPVLVIVDGLQTAFGGDMVNGEHVTRSFDVLKSLTRGGAAVLVLHHQSGGAVNSKSKDPAGNRHVRNQARVTYHLAGVGDGNDMLTLEATKANRKVSRERIRLHKTSSGGAMVLELAANGPLRLNLGGEGPSVAIAPLGDQELVLAAIRSKGGECLESDLWRAAMKTLGRTRQAVSKRLRPAVGSLVLDGQLIRQKAERNTYRLAIPAISQPPEGQTFQ